MLCDYYGIKQTYQENLLAKYYNLLGCDVVIIACTTESITDFINNKYDKAKLGYIVYDGDIKIIRLPYFLNVLNKLRNFKGIYNILEIEKPDLIFAHDIYFNLWDAIKYKKAHNIKLILDYHADYTNSGKNWISLNILHRIIRKLYFKRAQKWIDKIYPVVPESARFLNEVYDISYDEMELLPLGFDSQEMEHVRTKTNQTVERQKLGIGESDIVILTGGKFNKLKGTHLAIDALSRLRSKNVHLLIFGKAETGSEGYETELKKSADGLNVHFLGWIQPTEAYKYMIISDIALFPSSQSVLWQQCIGAFLPVIAGDSGLQDMSYLNQNDNLIKVSTQNINAISFAQIIDNLIENPDKMVKMKIGAEKTAREYLDYRIIARKTLKELL